MESRDPFASSLPFQRAPPASSSSIVAREEIDNRVVDRRVPLDHVSFFKFAVSFGDDAGPVASHALAEPLAPSLFSFFDCRVTREPALNIATDILLYNGLLPRIRPEDVHAGGKRPIRKTVVNCWKNGCYNASLGSGYRGPKEERLLGAQRQSWALFE